MALPYMLHANATLLMIHMRVVLPQQHISAQRIPGSAPFHGYSTAVRGFSRASRLGTITALNGPLASNGRQFSKTSRRQIMLGLQCCAACGCNIQQEKAGWYQKYFAWAMAKFGPEYEKQAVEVKRALFEKFITTNPDVPTTLLEVGAGTLPNAAYYTGCDVTAVDPNPAMAPYAQEAAARHALNSFSAVQGVAEQLPFEDNSFDRVVCTLVLCSVTDVAGAVKEIHRVLRPGGKYLFLEHVAAGQDKPVLRATQNLLTPLQSALADGCHLNRDPLETIRQAGFSFEKEQRLVMPGLSLLGPHVAGIAVA